MKPIKSGRESTAKPVDWSEIHCRLHSAYQRSQNDAPPSIDECREILRARARQLAHAPAPTRAHEDGIEVIEFRLAHEHYAVESRFVREVSPLTELAPLPCTPAFVLGIVNLRGRMTSVIDIKRFFELPIKGLTTLDRIIVLASAAMEFGVLADSIVGTRFIAMHELQAALPTLTGIRAEYLLGLGPERVVVLDAGRLLNDKRIVVNERTNIQVKRG